jgi:hypothetical protein
VPHPGKGFGQQVESDRLGWALDASFGLDVAHGEAG